MAPKADRLKKPTTVLDRSKVSEAMIQNMVTQGMLAARAARPHLKGESAAHPLKDEVNVFRDFFLAGLRFPLTTYD